MSSPLLLQSFQTSLPDLSRLIETYLAVCYSVYQDEHSRDVQRFGGFMEMQS